MSRFVRCSFRGEIYRAQNFNRAFMPAQQRVYCVTTSENKTQETESFSMLSCRAARREA